MFWRIFIHEATEADPVTDISARPSNECIGFVQISSMKLQNTIADHTLLICEALKLINHVTEKRSKRTKIVFFQISVLHGCLIASRADDFPGFTLVPFDVPSPDIDTSAKRVSVFTRPGKVTDAVHCHLNI